MVLKATVVTAAKRRPRLKKKIATKLSKMNRWSGWSIVQATRLGER